MYPFITILGCLECRPLARYIPGGELLTGFTMNVTRRYSAPGGTEVCGTTRFTVDAIGWLATLIDRCLDAGDRVLITGWLDPSGRQLYEPMLGEEETFLLHAVSIRVLESSGEGARPAVSRPLGYVPSDLPF